MIDCLSGKAVLEEGETLILEYPEGGRTTCE